MSPLPATLNAPPLVAVSGAVAVSLLPVLQQAIVDSSFPFLIVKLFNSLLYGLNVFATQQPGRIDGRQQDEEIDAVEKQKKKKGSGDVDVYLSGRRGRSLLAPSGWAFAIWGPIFAGELFFCTASALVKESSPVAAVIRRASAGFMVAQFVQSLWAAAFRPKYKGKLIYISAALLSGVAYSLSRSHSAFTSCQIGTFTPSQYLMYFLPITLHFGWATAATLVSWNGNIAQEASAQVIAWTGHLSAIGAAAIGVIVTLSRNAPVFGGVIAWALTACATGMSERLEKTEGEDRNRAGIYGARIQRWLCGLGAVLSGAASVVTVVAPNRKE